MEKSFLAILVSYSLSFTACSGPSELSAPTRSARAYSQLPVGVEILSSSEFGYLKVSADVSAYYSPRTGAPTFVVVHDAKWHNSAGGPQYPNIPSIKIHLNRDGISVNGQNFSLRGGRMFIVAVRDQPKTIRQYPLNANGGELREQLL